MKKTNRLIMAAAFIIGFVLIAICIGYEDFRCIDSLQFICQADKEVAERICLYADDDQYYAFLPSYSDFRTIRIEYTPGCSLFLDGKYYNSDTDCSGLTVDKEYSMIIKNTLGMTICKKSLIIKKADNIAALHIHLTNGTIKNINSHKDVSKTGYFSLIKENKEIDYSGIIKGIHGRGNSSWNTKKKSYTLQLPEEINLLNMGAGKNWVLLSNVFDESGLRNKTAFETAKKLGIRFAIEAEYVDLYIDKTYYGLYLLTERVDVGENRVAISDLGKKTQDLNRSPLSSYPSVENNSDRLKKWYDIPNNPEDITGGYLLQIEHHVDTLAEVNSCFQTHDLSVAVSSPKYASKNQLDYISGIFEKTEEELINNDTSGIDLDSFVDYYMIHELFDCEDPSSCYFYKESDRCGGKIYAGPIWDFDLSFGSGHPWLYYATEPDKLCYNKTNWFNYLYSNEDFRKLLNRKYADVIVPEIIPFVHNKLNEYAERIKSSYSMNIIRWKHSQRKNSSDYINQIHFDSLDDHVKLCQEYFDKKILIIGNEWKYKGKSCSVTFLSDQKSYVFFPLYGEVLNEEPDPVDHSIPIRFESLGWHYSEDNSQLFVGWYDADGNPYIPGRAITRNECYIAKWESIQPQKTVSASDNENRIKSVKSYYPKQKTILLVTLGGIGLAVLLFIRKDIHSLFNSRRGKRD